ncbi:hypothetical protein ACQJBY_041443 [Aegilops geniculata]
MRLLSKVWYWRLWNIPFPYDKQGAFGRLRCHGFKIRFKESVDWSVFSTICFAWLVGRRGSLSAGVQYKPLSGSKHHVPFTDPLNWNCAISYGMGSDSPLSPSLNFALELVRNTQLVASLYRNHVVGCTEGNTEYDFISPTNSIDIGLELAKRLDRDKPPENANDLSFQIAACWKPNEHVLVKGKAGLSKSSFAMVLNHPIMTFLTFNVAVERDHKQGTGSYGFGFCFKDI